MDQLHNMKEIKFPNGTYKDWEEKVAATLKGKTVESLFSSTYEGIKRKPLYTEQDIKGASNYFPKGASNDWFVSQKLPSGLSLSQLNDILQTEFKVGLEAVHFETKEVHIGALEDLHTLLHSINLTETPLHVYTGVNVSDFYNLLKEYLHTQQVNLQTITGYIGMDPIGEFAQTGELQLSEATYSSVANTIKEVPNVRTIWVRSEPYHEAGANAVQELAATMATAVEYLTQLIERGLSIDEAANTFVFSYNVGSDLFMELAKVRAAKVMWATIIQQFGGSTQAQQMTIHATTSSINKSILDEHVNMLRTTTEAFSAVVAGVNSLNIGSYSSKENTFSRRIARNTHYVLKDESFLNKVIDPAAGSYYIETLTEELAQNAWGYFQKIEKQGGIISALTSNTLQQDIQQVAIKRVNDIKNRKKKMVGVNMYPNLKDTLVPSETKGNLRKLRIAEAFENLRLQASEFKQNTSQEPTITLLNIGKLKEHKPRTDFATSFFQVGGLQVQQSPSLETIETINEWVSTEWKGKTVCICGTDIAYEENLQHIVQFLKEVSQDCFVIVAGKTKIDGVDETIHLHSNCYDQLMTIQTVLGVNKGEA
ncbi:hypothetical protein BC6307_14545 [Sutcliffiella cohnii]|uniref:Methylmalonyl-CoA mutase alpha/beta chain catalytic domain-containing protein n=1 Tax=Sutcliffiella cohnii TaxID=33932 RepID=A0A223KSF4_9BACI|nr:methylmalonyl-CoA mutase family protein [Sutcliffiella cohnii]AST92425.1 hypothetical protein BC6307_14545 [Sutcliffiella cohnii]